MTDLETLLAKWDDLDNAARRLLTSLPWQMTGAAAALEVQQHEFREVLHEYVTAQLKKEPS